MRRIVSRPQNTTPPCTCGLVRMRAMSYLVVPTFYGDHKVRGEDAWDCDVLCRACWGEAPPRPNTRRRLAPTHAAASPQQAPLRLAPTSAPTPRPNTPRRLALLTPRRTHHDVASTGVGTSGKGFFVAGNADLDSCCTLERKGKITLVDCLPPRPNTEHSALL